MTNRHKHRANRLVRGLLLSAAALLLGACEGLVVYHDYRALPREGWKRQDTLCFCVAVPDSFTTYRLHVEVRNNSAYPYQNLPLAVSGEEKDSLLLPAQAVSLTLTDSKGRWKGKGWGGMYQSTVPAGTLHIGQTDTCLIRVAYMLPDTLLKGICDVGIRLERTH